MQKRTDRLITNPEAFASSYEEENNNTPESNVKKIYNPYYHLLLEHSQMQPLVGTVTFKPRNSFKKKQSP